MAVQKQILVVEDEIIVAEDIRKRLENMGYTVPVVVSSGIEAIMKAGENNPDLVLMDIMLRGEMDGIEAAEKIRCDFDIPVIYLTAYADEKTLERARITEPYGYIIKPFNQRELQVNLEIAIYKHIMEGRLKESEQWLAAALKSIGDGVIATDPGGMVKFMNPIAEALTGWKQEDAMGKPLTTVFNIVSEEKGKKVEDPVAKVIREGIFYGLVDNTFLKSKGGTEIPIDIIGTPIKNRKDNMVGIIVTFCDIIERKRVEEELKRAAVKSNS
ncbi:MAG: response regulator [Candidatus Methanoperedens sp.]|nr:response regulator [Candidatus Methanoperedens sp.]MCZ7369430.1 response regulator [Candidatus Methanoperedens sp.]